MSDKNNLLELLNFVFPSDAEILRNDRLQANIEKVMEVREKVIANAVAHGFELCEICGRWSEGSCDSCAGFRGEEEEDEICGVCGGIGSGDRLGGFGRCYSCDGRGVTRSRRVEHEVRTAYLCDECGYHSLDEPRWEGGTCHACEAELIARKVKWSDYGPGGWFLAERLKRVEDEQKADFEHGFSDDDIPF